MHYNIMFLLSVIPDAVAFVSAEYSVVMRYRWKDTKNKNKNSSCDHCTFVPSVREWNGSRNSLSESVSPKKPYLAIYYENVFEGIRSPSVLHSVYIRIYSSNDRARIKTINTS